MKQLLETIRTLEYLRMNYREQLDNVLEQKLFEDIQEEYQETTKDQREEIIRLANDFKGGFNELYNRYPQAPSPTTIRIWMSELKQEEEYKEEREW